MSSVLSSVCHMCRVRRVCRLYPVVCRVSSVLCRVCNVMCVLMGIMYTVCLFYALCLLCVVGVVHVLLLHRKWILCNVRSVCKVCNVCSVSIVYIVCNMCIAHIVCIMCIPCIALCLMGGLHILVHV